MTAASVKSVIIIPARHSSARLPRKPLLAETGKPLVQHTYEQAAKSGAARVIVATDDARIATAVEGFGGEAVMTSPDHDSGTARIAEAARNLEAEGFDADVIINLQGDEPEVQPDDLNKLIDVHARAMTSPVHAFASTLVCPFPPEPASGPGSPMDPACVKAVLSAPDQEGLREALYFSRAPVPFPRDHDGVIVRPQDYYLHIGLYAFSAASLQAFAKMPHSYLEDTEKLEQLRILEAGERMTVTVVPEAVPGIDTPEDYAAFVARIRTGQSGRSAS